MCLFSPSPTQKGWLLPPTHGQSAEGSRRACVGKEAERKHFPLFTTPVKNETPLIVQPLKMGLDPCTATSRSPHKPKAGNNTHRMNYIFIPLKGRKLKLEKWSMVLLPSTKANILQGMGLSIQKNSPNSIKMQERMGFEG